MNSVNAIQSSYDKKEEKKGYVPEHYKPSRWKLTHVPVSPAIAFKGRPAPKYVPVWAVSDANTCLMLAKPLRVHIYRQDEFFFAENEALCVIGTGGSALDALCDFEQHVLHFWQHYRNLSGSQVTGDAVRLKTLYESLAID